MPVNRSLTWSSTKIPQDEPSLWAATLLACKVLCHMEQEDRNTYHRNIEHVVFIFLYIVHKHTFRHALLLALLLFHATQNLCRHKNIVWNLRYLRALLTWSMYGSVCTYPHRHLFRSFQETVIIKGVRLTIFILLKNNNLYLLNGWIQDYSTYCCPMISPTKW